MSCITTGPLARELRRYNSTLNGPARELATIAGNQQKLADSVRASGVLDPVNMPHNGTRLNIVQVLAIPTAGDTLPVITWKCPTGYFGVVNYISHRFTGTFTEGSGELIWSLGVQDYFFYGYGAMTVSLGDLNGQGWTVGGGLWVRSNQTVIYAIENVACASGGNIICSLQGWIAPTGNGGGKR